MVPDRTIVLAIADVDRRKALRQIVETMRWAVREVSGGAAALTCLEQCSPEALILDSWLPDLEARGLAEMVRQVYPSIYLICLDEPLQPVCSGNQQHCELLHAVKSLKASLVRNEASTSCSGVSRSFSQISRTSDNLGSADPVCHDSFLGMNIIEHLPGMVGDSVVMRDLARMVRLVAPHSARVLIEGETGSGKELVARAVHTLSGRGKSFTALNCAAIPEGLLEAELFGHLRGAFTGAVQSRVGRIEAANGGTLFLDEIGELPPTLQAKLLRFLENGEIQRIGSNESMQVDVRVVSATHQLLEKRIEQGSFRLDLYHRLATFPVYVPALRNRKEDLPMLAEFFLREFGRSGPKKIMNSACLDLLAEHSWPGNVRELQNVLQRAVILSGTSAELKPGDIRFDWSRDR